MLTQTFCHIQGIGRETERHLWSQGCRAWSQYLADPRAYEINGAAREVVLRELEASMEALERREHQYFRKALGQSEVWRAWPAFRESVCYLDIETDGGRRQQDVTIIGLYDGASFECLVKGRDLESFADLISGYSMIVTFCGAMFDVPILQKRFKHVTFDHLHLDLHPTLRKVGYRGGLKKIEKQLGIERSAETSGLTGLDAVYLWRDYLRGDERALARLIAYNREDVVNLERLTEICYERLTESIWSPAAAPASAVTA